MIFPPFVRSFWEASLIISQNPFTQEDSRSSRKDRVTRLINSCIEDNFVSIKYPGTWHLRRPGGEGDLIIRVSRGLIPMHRDGEFEPKPRLHVTFKSCASWQTSLERFQREGYSRKFLVGLCPPVFYFRPKNVIFPSPNPFLGVISKIHTRFQT